MKVEINTEKANLQMNVIHGFLSKTYWNKGLIVENMQTCIENSLNFGMYFEGKQIGYARVVTDFYRFAYLLDVFIVEEFQGKGLGKQLMDYVFNEPSIKNISTWKLATKDAHHLYEKFGFTALAKPERMMEKIIVK